MKIKKYVPYLSSILLALSVGGLSAIFTIKGMPYYETQQKPFFSPPEALFPIVWTILYILMGIGAAMVWQSRSPEKGKALLLYGIQLAVNFFWSVIFFGLHQYFFAFLWLLLLIGLIIRMIQAFGKVNKTAAKLQIPYLLWCCFAAVLNFAVWFLNR